jgi:hypothetical protein
VLKRAYVLADNKLALNASFDEEILAGELEGLLADGFDVSLTGFSSRALPQKSRAPPRTTSCR